MPRPHYAIQAGTRVQPRMGATPPAEADGECPNCKQKATEIERLKGALARSGGGGPRSVSASPAGKSTILMWAALAICGACMIFALAAFMRHG